LLVTLEIEKLKKKKLFKNIFQASKIDSKGESENFFSYLFERKLM